MKTLEILNILVDNFLILMAFWILLFIYDEVSKSNSIGFFVFLFIMVCFRIALQLNNHA